MANRITAQCLSDTFGCGDDYNGLPVVQFDGPSNARLFAYCANMNIDVDGNPLAYAPISKPGPKALEALGNAGWRPPTGATNSNAARKVQYDTYKKAVADNQAAKTKYEEAKKNLAAEKDTAKQNPLKQALQQAEKEANQKEADKKKAEGAMTDDLGYWFKPTFVSLYEKTGLFWYWYGVVSLPNDNVKPFPEAKHTNDGKSITVQRKPILDKTKNGTIEIYKDLYGNYPVIQSEFEPDPGYYVSQISLAITNSAYPSWDQRYFLRPGATTQVPYAAISGGLQAATKKAGSELQKLDSLLAIRLDTGSSLEFAFRDAGGGYKVGECSRDAFLALGGQIGPNNAYGRPTYRNDFLVLYLAFPRRQDPLQTLIKFSTASNADEFPMMLALVTQATRDAVHVKKKNGLTVQANPCQKIQKWQAWKKKQVPVFGPPAPPPAALRAASQTVIANDLRNIWINVQMNVSDPIGVLNDHAQQQNALDAFERQRQMDRLTSDTLHRIPASVYQWAGYRPPTVSYPLPRDTVPWE